MKQIKLLLVIVLTLLISILSVSPSEENLTNDFNPQTAISLIEETGLNQLNTLNANNNPKEDYIIKFKDDSKKILTINQDSKGQYKIKHDFKKVPFSLIEIANSEISNLKTSPEVESVELDQELELFGSEQTLPWGINKVNAPNVWNEVSGKNVKIGVIDSGISNHDDLSVVGGVSFIDDESYNDDTIGHGTSIAGVIASKNNDIGIVGVAPDSEIYSIKVIGSTGKLSDLLKGIEWSIENNMDVVVISLGVAEDSPALRELVDEAYLNGVLVVAASGRDGQLYYPAKYSSVIAVGSVDENNQLGSENGAGEEMELVAPGENILSTNNQNGYSSFSGTSMAAPHVAGVAALLKENNPSLTPNELRAKLQRDAIDLGDKGKDNNFGYGLVYANITEEDLSATIQLVFPEETNSTKKEELRINPIKIEIIKIENGTENIAQTLFYDGNQGTQNVSVEAGEYKVKQYFDDQVYSNEYSINDGEIKIVLLYDRYATQNQVIADVPWRIKSGESIPILLQIHDGDQNSYSIDRIDVYDDLSGLKKDTIDLSGDGTCFGTTYKTINTPLWYIIKYYSDSTFSKDINGIMKIRVEFVTTYCDVDVDVSKTVTVKIQNLPQLNNWYCGDTHYHSKYTHTLITGVYGEIGGPLDYTIDALNSMDFDWITVTDHSNSLTQNSGYWSSFKTECNGFSKCLIGEEVNCDYNSGNDQNNHYLSYDIPNLQQDINPGGSPTTNSCQQIIGEVSSQGGFGYAAHPESELLFGLAFGKWQDYNLNFNGLEIWNGDIITSSGNRQALIDGLNKWKTLLLTGREVFISAGSDAHGDFQDAFGKEYTCCYSSTAPGSASFKSNIFNSLENGKCYMGNNGALKFQITTNGNTVELGETGTVCEGDSATFTVDYNLINVCILKLYEGISGSSNESEVINWGSNSGEYQITFPITWSSGDSYYRVECVNTATNYRLYTNPIWINVNECSRTPITCTGSTVHDCQAVNSITSIDSFTVDDTTPSAGQTLTTTIDWTGYHYDDPNHWAFFLDSSTTPVGNCTSYQADANPSYYTMTCSVTIPSSTTSGPHTLKVTGNDYGGYCNPGEAGVDAEDLITINVVSGGGPHHTIWGYVNDAGDGTPADGSTVTVHIQGRSGETLTDTVGVIGNSGTANAWSINTGNFPTTWSVGENLIVEVDNGAGYTTNISIIMSSADSQQAPSMIITDAIPPTITINSPLNKTWSALSTITLNISLGETGKWINVSVDSGLAQNKCNDCNSTAYNLSPLGEGTHTVTVSASDYADNIATKTVEFYVDTIAPRRNSKSISNYNNYVGKEIRYQLNYSELNPKEITVLCFYNLSNLDDTYRYIDSNPSPGNNILWNHVMDLSTRGDNTGIYYCQFTMEDKAGNFIEVWSKSNLIIDKSPPSTSVSALNPTQTSYSFFVSWSGTDSASGIASYNIEVNDNGGGWTVWLDDTTRTGVKFTGEAGHTYQFRSKAKDNVGNTETKVAADVSTTMDIAEVSINLNLSAGWNMVSLPLELENGSVDNIFGDCVSTLDIKPIVKWQSPLFASTTEVEAKEGYWLFSPLSTTCNLTGLPIANRSLVLKAGWNMVGTVDSVSDLDIALIPNQVEVRPAVRWQSPIFVETTTIKSGKSVWVFVTQNTEVEI